MNRLTTYFLDAEEWPSARPARAGRLMDLDEARHAQAGWAGTPVRQRVALIRRVRHLMAERSQALACTVSQDKSPALPAETLTAEVLPLAEACRFLERNAARLLAPRRLGRRQRPFWLHRVEAEIHREPLGVILIIAPSNYSLFLPAAQALQALAAGNAVVWKPGDGGTAAARAFAELLQDAGLDHRLLRVLPEDVSHAQAAIEAGVDKVLLTGSATTGVSVLRALAPRLVPATMELSGCDAVLVRADADVALTADALVFGLQLNQGATCIAPRRVFVHHSRLHALEAALIERLAAWPRRPMKAEINHRVLALLVEAMACESRIIAGKIEPGGQVLGPLVIRHASTAPQLFHADLFAPVLSILGVQDDEHALRAAGDCPYALGATIFTGDLAAARNLAARINAGVVTINDLIVPTADPRIPFGGRKRSGFGSTRGAEGLLEMTAPKVISIHHGKSRPHCQPAAPGDGELFSAYIALAHGRGWGFRWRALRRLLRALLARKPVKGLT